MWVLHPYHQPKQMTWNPTNLSQQINHCCSPIQTALLRAKFWMSSEITSGHVTTSLGRYHEMMMQKPAPTADQLKLLGMLSPQTDRLLILQLSTPLTFNTHQRLHRHDITAILHSYTFHLWFAQQNLIF